MPTLMKDFANRLDIVYRGKSEIHRAMIKESLA